MPVGNSPSAQDSLKNHRECESMSQDKRERERRKKARDRVCGRGHRDVAEIIGEGEKFAHDGEKFSSASIRSRSCDLPNVEKE